VPSSKPITLDEQTAPPPSPRETAMDQEKKERLKAQSIADIFGERARAACRVFSSHRREERGAQSIADVFGAGFCPVKADFLGVFLESVKSDASGTIWVLLNPKSVDIPKKCGYIYTFFWDICTFREWHKYTHKWNYSKRFHVK
jgi:hypothetical protein